MTDKQSGTGTELEWHDNRIGQPVEGDRVMVEHEDGERRQATWTGYSWQCEGPVNGTRIVRWARSANPVSRAGDCPGDKEPCADVNLCANVGQCRTVGDAQHRREYVEENRDETLDTDAVRGLILNILAGHRVDQFPPEKQMLEECLRLLRETPGVGRDYKALYEELLYAVANKYEGESRHETALRYIREREEPKGGTEQCGKQSLAAGASK